MSTCRDNEAAITQFAPGIQIVRAAPALLVGSKRAAKLGAFVPLEAEPMQVFVYCRLRIRAWSADNRNLELRKMRLPAAARSADVCPESAGMTQVQVAGEKGASRPRMN